MNRKTVKYGLIALLLVFAIGNLYAKKKYLIIDTTNIQNMERLKFNIENFEKNQEMNDLKYIKEDGTSIWQYKSGYEYYVEKEYPPFPKLYYIYREYYLNGNIKEWGFMLRTAFPIGIWKYYDEQGNLTKEENVDAVLKEKAKFDYNQVFLFLDREKRINIKTGKGREEVTIGINEEAHCWDVNVWPRESNRYKGICYMIDLNTGKVKEKYPILRGGE
jgi:hypothetical protein